MYVINKNPKKIENIYIFTCGWVFSVVVSIQHIFKYKHMFVSNRKKMLWYFDKIKIESRISNGFSSIRKGFELNWKWANKILFLVCVPIFGGNGRRMNREHANKREKKHTTKQMRSITMSNEYTFDLWFFDLFILHSLLN